MKRGSRDLDSASFEALLTALHGDRDGASREYERLRLRLIGFFSLHGAAAPEELADEALNRLARRISEGEPIQNIPGYLGGIARILLREEWNNAQREKANRQYAPAAGNWPNDGDAALEALELCLEQLPAESRSLIQRYYSVDGKDRIRVRNEMAGSLGISMNALRNRALRIRKELERCVEKSLTSLQEQDTRPANFTNRQKD